MEFTKNEAIRAGALRRLLKTRYLIRSRNESWFQIVIDLRTDLQKILDTMAIALEINETLGVAFLRPMSDEIEDTLAYNLGRRKTLGAMASALLIKLRFDRLQFFLNPSISDAPLVSGVEMRDFLENFNSAKMDSQFERTFRKAIEELTELQVLIETKPESGLYEISPLCEILLPMDKLQATKDQMEKYFAHFTTVQSPEGSDVR